MTSNSKLRAAVRLGLGMGAGALAVGFAPGVMAQGADDGEELEEIITTGSRIKRADLDSASPVTVLQRDDILSSGITDVGNIIQKMPSMSGSSSAAAFCATSKTCLSPAIASSRARIDFSRPTNKGITICG